MSIMKVIIMKGSTMKTKTLFSLLIAPTLSAALILSLPLASVGSEKEGESHGSSGHHFVPKDSTKKLNPAPRYQGKTPIDLSNGIPFNNGTVGEPNPEIEKWGAAHPWAVGLAELPYPFERKAKFIQNLDERLSFYENAIWNWNRVSDITKPEVKEYAEKAKTDIAPRLERARNAWAAAKSAGSSDWEKAQDDAKRSFLELQSFYYSLHKNVISTKR